MNNLEKFALELIYSFANQSENILISPTRLMFALAYIYTISDVESKNKILNLLGYEDKEDLHKNLSTSIIMPTEEIPSYYNEKDIKDFCMEVSSSIWIDKDIDLTQTVKESSDRWGVDIIRANFSSKETKKRISEYVMEHTHKLIRNFNYPLDSLTKAVILDCMFFKAKWRMTFDTEDTYKDIFYGKDFNNEVHFMKVRLRVGKYYSCRAFHAIELDYRCPCEERNYSMRIYLPIKGKKCEDVIKRILNKKESIVFEIKPVILDLPKYSISTEINLSNFLKEHGLPLQKVKVNLSEDNIPEFVIDDVIQKSSLRVTEKGTEAGTSTYTSVMLGLPRKIKYINMKVNSPFVFEIIERNSGSRLYSGIINNLSSASS